MIKIALATFVDSRTDFYSKRKPLVDQELKSLAWLREAYQCLESEPICTKKQVASFFQKIVSFGAQALIIHLPIWADPIFSIMLVNSARLPVLLLGNSRPETSSTVGLLGAGGALDQIDRKHTRVFEHNSESARQKIHAFIRAAATLETLRGQTLGLFGGRSLGIFTTVADPAQWQSLFGVDIETYDQLEIERLAKTISDDEVNRHGQWLLSQLGSVTYGDKFTTKTFADQIRSHLATRALAKQYDLDFLGVKCQPELSDGYVSQCVAHMLSNGNCDADGSKEIIVHACESDADGALTMQILHLLSDGKPAALMDIRWYDAENERWILANCGAVPAAFCATCADPSGLSSIHMKPHIFGKGGGGALPGIVSPQIVTLARLCRKNGKYWMAIVRGEIVLPRPEDAERITPVFPKAFVKTSAGSDFLEIYGSNHIHMVSGDFSKELIALCDLLNLPYQFWH